MRHNSSVLFHLKLYMLYTKGAHQNGYFQACNCSHGPNSLYHFSYNQSIFFKYCITLQCHDTLLLCNFLAQILYTLAKRSLLKCKFWNFQVLSQKFSKFLKSFFKAQVSSFSNIASFFSAMIDNSSITLYALDKKIPWK